VVGLFKDIFQEMNRLTSLGLGLIYLFGIGKKRLMEFKLKNMKVVSIAGH
jgi:hypothetical protein